MQKSLLILEDDVADLASMRNIALAAGWRVITAVTLAKAMMQLEGATPFDLVVVDLNLPDSKNMETLTKIRDMYKGPFLVVSGHLENGGEDALTVAQVPFICKRENWRDDFSIEMQTFGTKGGIPAATAETAERDCMLNSDAVTKMFATLHQAITDLTNRVDRLSSELNTEVVRVTNYVFGHWADESRTKWLPGCTEFCSEWRTARGKASSWAWGTACGVAGAAISALTAWAAVRIANG